MSREEAVEAYTAGRISRRSFIRHLIAAGVTAAAAVTYADVLAPQRSDAVVQQAVAQDLYGFYGPFDPGGFPTGFPGQTGTVHFPTAAELAAEQAQQAGAASPVQVDPNFTG